MSAFTEGEIEYLRKQRLGRLATVDASGEPHVVPVGFRYNDELETIDIGGRDLGKSKKFRDAGATGRAAFVVDDVLPPWRPRGIEVRGATEALGMGSGAGEELIRIRPRRIVGWGIDSDVYGPNSRDVD